jgi:hypothetical protein
MNLPYIGYRTLVDFQVLDHRDPGDRQAPNRAPPLCPLLISTACYGPVGRTQLSGTGVTQYRRATSRHTPGLDERSPHF